MDDALDLLGNIKPTRRTNPWDHVPRGTSEQDHKRFDFAVFLGETAEKEDLVGVDVNVTRIGYEGDPAIGLTATYYDHSGLTWSDWEAFRPFLDQDSADFFAAAIVGGALYRRGHGVARAERGSGAALATVARAWEYEVDDGQVCYKFGGVAEEILLECGLDRLVEIAEEWLVDHPEPPAQPTAARNPELPTQPIVAIADSPAQVLDEVISIADAAKRLMVNLQNVSAFVKRRPELRVGQSILWGQFCKAWHSPDPQRRRAAVMKKKQPEPTASHDSDDALFKQLKDLDILPANLEEIAKQVHEAPLKVKLCLKTHREVFRFDEKNKLWDWL